ncbi:hypothetical protein BASA81_004746 [Batrachochytrium salamandrivorans]|nr:hypothetical protein BASA81_004746 [Batrachochytrium salamandrivorans]
MAREPDSPTVPALSPIARRRCRLQKVAHMPKIDDTFGRKKTVGEQQATVAVQCPRRFSSTVCVRRLSRTNYTKPFGKTSPINSNMNKQVCIPPTPPGSPRMSPKNGFKIPSLALRQQPQQPQDDKRRDACPDYEPRKSMRLA